MRRASSGEKERKGLTRRDFMQGAAGTAALAALGTGRFREAGAETPGSSKVVLVRHPDALDARHRPVARAIREMLDQGVQTLLGTESPTQAWKRLVRPDELVGIKTNVWHYMPTPHEVEDAVKARVLDAGVPPDRIRITDRAARKELRDCTALINVRPLRTHHWAGIGGCLKNYIMFERFPFRYHPNACADLGHIWTLPMVRGKTRLNILAVLRPLFHGRGPHHYNERFVWDYKGILLSEDPVAADAVGVRLLEAKRREFFGAEKPFPKNTRHVVYADVKHHVGNSDPEKIKLIKVGWSEGVLL